MAVACRPRRESLSSFKCGSPWAKACRERRSTPERDLGQEPYIVGGYRRLDGEITAASDGRWLAKEGAGGLLAIQSREEIGCEPFSLIIKTNHGLLDQHLGLVAWALFESHQDRLPREVEVLDYLTSQKSQWVGSGNLMRRPAISSLIKKTCSFAIEI